MMKKLITLTAVVLMLAMLVAGCTPATTTTAGTTAGTTAATTTKAGETTTAGTTTEGTTTEGKPATWIADRVIQGRIFLENDGAMLPADQANTPVAQKIKELTGITINWKSTGANDGLQELTLALAARDVPEVLVNYLNDSGRQEASVLFKAAREGMFEDLAPYLSDTQIYSKYNDPAFLPADTFDNIVHRDEFNGAVYLIHMNVDRPREASEVTYTGQGTVGVYPLIRWDIIKSLGKTPSDIKTWDDFLNLCQMIKDGNFSDANGKTVSVIGPRVWGGDIVSSIYRAFNWGNGTRFGVDTDGKIKHVTETPWAMQQVKAMRTLKERGFLHAEYFTMENSRAEEGLLNGSWAISAMSGYNEAMGEQAYVPLAHILNYAGEEDVYYGAERTGYCTWEVIKGTEKPEEIVKFADFLASKEGKLIWQYGIEGLTYDLKDGQPRIKQEIFVENATDTMAFKDKYGFNLGGGFQWWLLGSTDNYAKADFGEETPGQEFDPMYQARAEINAYANVTKLKPMLEAPNATSFLGDPAMAEITPNLDPVLTQQEWSKTFVQAVLAGSEAEAEEILANYLQRLKDAGLEEFRSFIQSKYDADPNSVRFYNIDNY